MQRMRIAVLDLGTNVFNMILSEFTPQGGCKSVKEYKCAAKLGAGGLSNGLIAPTAFDTATAALDKIMAAIEEAGGADKIIPYATSAVRDASNGLEFANFLNARYGFEIRIIPGEREAELIFKGIMESVGHLRGSDGKFATGENALMLDIDNFKSINDTFGHHIGDTVLKKAAAYLLSVFNDEHYRVFRIGGDEFAVIAVDVSRKTLDEKVQQVCNPKEDLKCSFSCGYSLVDFERKNAMENAFIDADLLMYKQKESKHLT